MKILVIDDDAAVRKFITLALEKEGYTVVDTDSGITGLELLNQKKEIDLMITDLIMPEQEGIETIIEARKRFPALKIIAISGGGKVGAENFLVLADALGANGTLKKPFTSQELVMSVKVLE